MKTYTQKQYDNAKRREFKKGYDLGFAQGNLGVEMDDALELAQQIKDWKKLEQFDRYLCGGISNDDN